LIRWIQIWKTNVTKHKCEYKMNRQLFRFHLGNRHQCKERKTARVGVRVSLRWFFRLVSMYLSRLFEYASTHAFFIHVLCHQCVIKIIRARLQTMNMLGFKGFVRRLGSIWAQRIQSSFHLLFHYSKTLSHTSEYHKIR